MEVGDELGPERRRAPALADVLTYLGGRPATPLFVDAGIARAHGLAGVIAPGPMLTAYLEQYVRRRVSGWVLEALGVTFRVPTVAGSEIELRGVVSEHHEMADGERLVCDLVVVHADGTVAVTGTARLFRPSGEVGAEGR